MGVGVREKEGDGVKGEVNKQEKSSSSMWTIAETRRMIAMMHSLSQEKEKFLLV